LTAEEEEEDAVSDRLALYNIEEIGPATEKRLREAGFKSIRDLLVRGPWIFQNPQEWRWMNQLTYAIRLE
jgi:nucleotidyltransferase/DNA polymerase involved in DNA repair